jgi:hypothetical protein
LLWTHHEARRHGFPVHEAKLAAWTRKGLALSGGDVENAFMLLARPQVNAGDSLDGAIAKLVEKQQADGSWRYRGKTIDRAGAENVEVTTLWALLALETVAPASAASAAARTRALAWLKRAPVGDSSEALITRTLAERRFGDPARARALLATILGRQNADGGWSWLKDHPSDAYATGQALYLLAEPMPAGTAAALAPAGAEAAVARARAYLMARQRADGTWYAPTRTPEAVDNDIASTWGTAWATLGLIASSP